jgi:uncharacterized membrane protein YhaH (DUF805 family)
VLIVARIDPARVRRIQFWFGILLAVCGAGGSVLGLFLALASRGQVDIVGNWLEFACFVVLFCGGVALAVIYWRDRRGSAS